MQMEYIWWCASLVGYHLHVYIHIYIYMHIYIIIIIYLYNTSTNAEMYERGGPPPQSGGMMGRWIDGWMMDRWMVGSIDR